MRPAPVVVAAPSAEAGDFEVDMSEPAPKEKPSAPMAMSKPSHPAPTVMFEPGGSRGDMGMAKVEKPTPMAAPAREEEAPEDVEPEESTSRHTPTKSKAKGKQGPRKIYKPKSGLSSQRAGEDDDDGTPKKSSSKTGIVVFLILFLCAAGVVGFVILRGGKTSDDAKATDEPATAAPKPKASEPAPSDEPAALAPTATERPAPPPSKPVAEKPSPAEKPARADKPVAEKPAPAEKPARADKPVAEKPAPAEKPARADKPAPSDKPKFEPVGAGPEPKAGGKGSEEDFRRANEAYQRGNAKLFAGNTTEAIAEFSQAVRLNPKDPANHRGLGLAYAQAGKAGEATKHLKLYLKEAPKATDRGMIEKKLDQLKGQ